MENNSLIGEYLTQWREVHKISLRQLAARAGISHSQLSKIENGKAIPSRKTVEHLAYATNIDKDELFILCGYVDDEIKEEVVDVLDKIRAIEYAMSLSAYNEVACSIEDTRSLDEVVKEAVSRTYSDFTSDELEWATKEMLAALSLFRKRLKKEAVL